MIAIDVKISATEPRYSPQQYNQQEYWYVTVRRLGASYLLALSQQAQEIQLDLGQARVLRAVLTEHIEICEREQACSK